MRLLSAIVSVACLTVPVAVATPATAAPAPRVRVVPGVDITPPGGYTQTGYRINNRGQALLFSGNLVWQHGRWTDLGTLGGSYTDAQALSEAGDVVGESGLPGDTDGHAFRWRNGRMTDLGSLGGWSVADSAAANDNVSGKSVLPDGSMHVFHWRAGKMTDTGIPSGMLGRTKVNAHGQIAADHTDDEFTHSRGYFWDKGKFVDIGTLGGKWVYIMDINDRGDIIGNASTPDGTYHGFLYTRGRMIDLGTFGGYESDAFDINNRGQITGTAGTYQGPDRAYRWENGVMTALGDDGDRSSGTAINERGDVVGARETAAGHAAGVVWSGRQTIELGMPDPGRSTGYDINDSGVVVGSAYSASSVQTVRLWRTRR